MDSDWPVGRARALRVVLGDQLTHGRGALADLDPADDIVLMAEVAEEATYVPHHRKKIAFLFSAMRHFAAELRDRDVRVAYRRFDEAENAGSLRCEVIAAVERYRPERIVVTHPGEWRVLEDIQGWADVAGIPVEILEDDRFLISISDFGDWAKTRKQMRMEHFYRRMRRALDVLLDADGQPVGGEWNYDSDNRKSLGEAVEIPARAVFEPDTITRNVLTLVGEHFLDGFGDLEPFDFAVTAEQAQAAFGEWLDGYLPQFGDYQDAMKQGEDTLFHAVIGLYLNAGLLDPMEVVRRVEAAYAQGKAPLNAVEGFIRQIIGWREYVRGLYWHYMPDYAETNHFAADRALPSFYWTGRTRMACVHAVVDQTRRRAYAHHIQRLMVTGTFALLAGIAPKQVCEWYLAVYADAYEWVELPNTHGMALFADGGLMASKPYAASGSYINKMSDYCGGCSYSVTAKTGAKACPFNYLYWDFLARNRDKLDGNPRMGMVYRTYDRMTPEKHEAIASSAETFFDALARDEDWAI